MELHHRERLRDPEEQSFELLLYGNEQILQGADNATLVAFAALAYQQIRGRGEIHHDIGCGFLLLSVMMCALVHFAMGNAYIGRARKLMRGSEYRHKRRSELVRKSYLGLALFAAFLQCLCILIGCLLILPEKPFPFLAKYVLPYFT